MLANEKIIEDAFSSFVSDQKKSEQDLCQVKRGKSGVFLTNGLTSVDTIINQLVDSKDLLSKTILEPACGHGIFILRLLLRAYKLNPDAKVLQDFISNNIYFCDIDDDMLEKTKSNISAFYKKLFGQNFEGKFNSYCLDFTIKTNNKTASSLKKMHGEFDYIISNPPFVTLYGRRDKKKSEETREYFLLNYDQFPPSVKNGKINYVMLFIEHGLNFLKKSGKLSFIVDVSFFETAYLHCRKYLVQNYRINNLFFNIEDFEGVGSGQVIITITNDYKKNNVVDLIDVEKNTFKKIKQEEWNNEDDEFQFRFPQSENEKIIQNKILFKKDPSLKDLYPNKNLRTCVMLLDMEKKFTSEYLPDNIREVKSYPYYRGSKSIKRRYSKPIYEHLFYYDKELQNKINDRLKEELIKQGIKNKKRLGLGESCIYDNPKVYIRQSAKEIIATYDPEPSAANNSLYLFSLRDNSDNTILFLKFLCGFLNSKVATYYAQKYRIIRYNKGKQPQIKISDLYKIPIPSDMKLRTKIASLVDKILLNSENHTELGSDIDNLLYDYYGFDGDLVLYINSFIQSYLK